MSPVDLLPDPDGARRRDDPAREDQRPARRDLRGGPHDPRQVADLARRDGPAVGALELPRVRPRGPLRVRSAPGTVLHVRGPPGGALLPGDHSRRRRQPPGIRPCRRSRPGPGLHDRDQEHRCWDAPAGSPRPGPQAHPQDRRRQIRARSRRALEEHHQAPELARSPGQHLPLARQAPGSAVYEDDLPLRVQGHPGDQGIHDHPVQPGDRATDRPGPRHPVGPGEGRCARPAGLGRRGQQGVREVPVLQGVLCEP